MPLARQSRSIICDALIDYAERRAEKLNELSVAEEDASLRAELQRMASICRKVPRHPPEAFQSVWFVQVANWAEASGSAHSFGRFDQYMLPFYRADIDADRLTRDEALELIECLWLKLL